MAKEMYRLIDSRSWVYLPKELRLALGMENGSFVKLVESEGGLQRRKVHLIGLGDHIPEAIEAYVAVAASAMPHEKKLQLAARLLEQLNEKKEATECGKRKSASSPQTVIEGDLTRWGISYGVPDILCAKNYRGLWSERQFSRP